MKNALSIIMSILLLTSCTSTTVPDESNVDTNEVQVDEKITFESIEGYIDAIHAEWPGENKFFFEDGTTDYSIEGYELVVNEDGEPVVFENGTFWVYAETAYESKLNSSTSFYLRGMEGPRDAVYGPFEGNLLEMLR